MDPGSYSTAILSLLACRTRSSSLLTTAKSPMGHVKADRMGGTRVLITETEIVKRGDVVSFSVTMRGPGLTRRCRKRESVIDRFVAGCLSAAPK